MTTHSPKGGKCLAQSTSLPNWNTWLMQQAEAGSADALAVLRAHVEREERMRGDLLTAERAEKAKIHIMESLKPQARKDGTMAYRTADGGLVLDRANHVKAERATAGAALVALSLAVERFEGQALDAQGTEQFRHDVAKLAGMHHVDVTFTDPAMEALREGFALSKKAAAATGPAAVGNPTIVRWIDARNSHQGSAPTTPRNRLWTPDDVGRATYQGRRRMEDGSEVLLLKRGDEILVKPSGPRIVAK
ncbi:MAG: hypothetical protein H6851_07710 [Geminicoccaceae bacterium]|nr:hypothetical protein [Geminicoccaceae bacterium]